MSAAAEVIDKMEYGEKGKALSMIHGKFAAGVNATERALTLLRNDRD